MQPKSKQASVTDLYQTLQASGSDYLLLAAALAVPLYTSGVSILQPVAGVIFVALCWAGILCSFLVRSMGVPKSLTNNLGWILLALAILVALNLDSLNSRLPGGGFPWQMAPAAFLCFFVVLASFFLWSDGVMHFLLVPGIALFGVQSYIETAGNFVLSLILFMISVAVLLTRLHIRYMVAAARSAGYWDTSALYSGPWKAMAGPVLAILSVLVVAGSSYIIAPQLGGAVRKLAGEPEIRFDPPRFGANTRTGESLASRIGNGPITASNQPVVQITSQDSFEYLRSRPLGFYRGTGWTSGPTNWFSPSPEGGRMESGLENALGYTFLPPRNLPVTRQVRLLVEGLGRTSEFAYSPGLPLRIEYAGQVGVVRGEFPIIGDRLPRGSKYYIRAGIHDPDPAELRSVESPPRQDVISLYRGINRDRVSERVQTLADSIANRYPNNYDCVMAFIREIQSRTKYNVRAARIEGDVDRVEAFLFETREGYCDLFASSLAVLCRSAGIRARAVSGFLLPSERDETYIVRDRNAHMWTEVYFEGHGWITFDATDGAEAVPGGEIGSLLEEEEPTGDLTWAAYTAAGVFGLAVLALIVGSYLAWRKANPPLPTRYRALRPLYQRFMRVMRPLLMRPRLPSETTSEYALAYSYATHNGETAIKLARMFDSAMYAKESPSNEDIAEISILLSQFESLKIDNGK